MYNKLIKYDSEQYELIIENFERKDKGFGFTGDK